MPRQAEKRMNKFSDSRTFGEKMQNPMAHGQMREVNVLDEAMKDGAHVLTKMGMMPKRTR